MTAPLPLADLEPTAPRSRPHVLLTNDLEVYLLTGLLLFGPLAFGAVEPWAIFVLQFVSVAVTVVWFLRQIRTGRVTLRWNPIFVPMCAFAALNIVQCLPGMSGYPHATRSYLLLNVSYALVCFLLTQVLDRTTHLRRLGVTFAIYGFGVALFAVLQNLSSPTKLYWLRTPRFSGWIYGPYVNHNHYAGLMEMLVPIPLVFAFSRYAHGRKKWLAVSAAAFMGASVFLSGSRGGMAALAVEMAIFFWLLFRERTRNRVALLLGAFFLVTVVSILYTGGSEVSSRVSTLADFKHPDVSADMRLKIAGDTLRMFQAHPLTGWGAGTFADIYPQFRSFYTESFVNAAHNDYLQALAETGLAGFVILLWFLITALSSALRKTKNWPSDVNGIVSLAALLGISGILVHSLVDFNLEIPANAMLFYTLCTIAALDSRFRNLRREHRPMESEVVLNSEEPMDHTRGQLEGAGSAHP